MAVRLRRWVRTIGSSAGGEFYISTNLAARSRRFVGLSGRDWLVACRRAILRGLTSNDNVELVRSFYPGRECEPFIDLLDEEVEFDFSAHPVPGPAVLRG